MILNLGKDLYLKGRIGWRGLNKDEYLTDSNYRIINATALMDRYVDWDNCGFISEERYLESPEIMLQENDILISKDGTLGKIGYVKNLKNPTTVAAGIFVLRNTKPEVLNFDYLYHILKSPIFKDFVFRNKAMGSTINHLYQEDLAEFEIELPDIAIQNKIVDILNSIDNKIDLNIHEISDIEYLQELYFNRWFIECSVPMNTESKTCFQLEYNANLNHIIPNTWKVCDISEFLDVRDGTHDSPKQCEEGKFLITSKHLTEMGIDYTTAYKISEADYHAINLRSKVDKGDILYSMIGTIGNIYIIEEDSVNFAIKNVALFKTSKRYNLRNFIYMWLKSPYMKRYVEEKLSGSIQKFIGLGDLRSMPIIEPNDIVYMYCDYFDESFEKVFNLKKENQMLRELYSWLSPLLLTNKVFVS